MTDSKQLQDVVVFQQFHNADFMSDVIESSVLLINLRSFDSVELACVCMESFVDLSRIRMGRRILYADVQENVLLDRFR